MSVLAAVSLAVALWRLALRLGCISFPTTSASAVVKAGAAFHWRALVLEALTLLFFSNEASIDLFFGHAVVLVRLVFQISC